MQIFVATDRTPFVFFSGEIVRKKRQITVGVSAFEIILIGLKRDTAFFAAV